MSILDKIKAFKIEEIAYQKNQVSESFLRNQAEKIHFTQGFKQKLAQKIATQGFGFVAEVKRSSPYYGLAVRKFIASELTLIYEQGGAACIAVHTDKHFFKGKNEDLEEVRKTTQLPILRKDFIISKYQIYESICLGADAILLTLAMLDIKQLKNYNLLARELGLDVVLEVNTQAELELAMQIPNKIICLNSRNLQTMQADINLGLQLVQTLTKSQKYVDMSEQIIMLEGGINSKAQIQLLQENNIKSCILGGALINAKRPLDAMNRIFT